MSRVQKLRSPRHLICFTLASAHLPSKILISTLFLTHTFSTFFPTLGKWGNLSFCFLKPEKIHTVWWLAFLVISFYYCCIIESVCLCAFWMNFIFEIILLFFSLLIQESLFEGMWKLADKKMIYMNFTFSITQKKMFVKKKVNSSLSVL